MSMRMRRGNRLGEVSGGYNLQNLAWIFADVLVNTDGSQKIYCLCVGNISWWKPLDLMMDHF